MEDSEEPALSGLGLSVCQSVHVGVAHLDVIKLNYAVFPTNDLHTFVFLSSLHAWVFISESAVK